MNTESWHSEFNPSKFLSRVNFARLVERNEAYNANFITDARSPCILCGNHTSHGILLNDKSFLCQKCYSDVALISYPERYELLRRQFVVETEARRLAWEGFRNRFECKSEGSVLVLVGWVSLLFALANPALLVLTAALLVVGYSGSSAKKKKYEQWLVRKAQWENENPVPSEPALKHFHDPAAILTERDRQILRVFNHWPGYPPFWKYLRSVVLGKDSNRCQVTGCPSRLGLHVHHIRPVGEGGPHSPENLVSLCDFHHALEPEKGHERIWGEIKTRYFTLVSAHERSNRVDGGSYQVRAHLRRLELVSLDELRELAMVYGFCCPSCGETGVQFRLNGDKNRIKVECPACGSATEGPQQLAEETGPLLAEVLGVTRNRGRWRARWDMLSERRAATWGMWSGNVVTLKRKQHKEKVEATKSAPLCPKCGAPMRLVRPRSDDKWKAFWGCTQYSVTRCKGSFRFPSP